MIVSKLRAEIYAFFQIGLARGQFASDGEIAAPGSAAAGHPNFHLRFKVLSEESPAEMFQPPLQAFIHAVSGDIKESAFAAGAPDLGGHGVTTFCPADQRADVDDGNGRDFFQYFHMTILILKDVRENLHVDLQSAKLRKFMAITEPLAKVLLDRASGLSTVAQTVWLKFLHILCSQESHRRQPVEGSVPTYRGLERFPESHRRQPVDRSVAPFAFRYWARRLGLHDPPAAAGGIQEYS